MKPAHAAILSLLTAGQCIAPVRRHLLPGGDVGPRAWSEIRYAAYCWVTPEFHPPGGLSRGHQRSRMR